MTQLLVQKIGETGNSGESTPQLPARTGSAPELADKYAHRDIAFRRAHSKRRAMASQQTATRLKRQTQHSRQPEASNLERKCDLEMRASLRHSSEAIVTRN
ncbi:MAG: hypothetical protein ABSH20_28070 [Tepidisphaeraceae bacterium]|jgi:lysyl-tRNA synthetase class I